MAAVKLFPRATVRARRLATTAVLTWIACSPLIGSTLAAPRLLSRDDARRLGLERAWFAQVRLDPARHQVERAILNGDRLTALTTAGIVHELNALTGETVWIAPVGRPGYPSLGPAASDKFVALVNGSTLYVLRREDGKPVLQRPVSGGAGASPAVTLEYVFVPLISGRIEAYPLNQGKDKSHTPWYYESYGRAMVAPLATPDSIIWSTDQGRLYVGASLPPAVRFRLQTPSDIVAPAAYRKPLVYVATMHGELFALDEDSGERVWKYAAGYPVVRAPAAVGDRVYVTSDEPALHCVDAKTGNALWLAPNVKKFAAASEQRVYGIDDLGALVVMDANTGANLARIATNGTTDALVNDQTDRLYLISRDGLVQCLHEIGAREPLRHNPPSAAAPSHGPAATPVPSRTAAEPPSGAATVESQEQPPPARQQANPFGGPEEEPAEEERPPAEPSDFGSDAFGVDDDNPFGE